MNQRLNRNEIITPNGHSTKSRSDIKGVLFLLLSIRASLQRHGVDGHCSTIMQDCIASFQKRYNLTDEDMSEGIVWTETSIEALLRLLDYLRAEVKEQLNDQSCAQQLSLCIDRLMDASRVSP
jgi:hypothetical protein